jgi:hypothetical protein
VGLADEILASAQAIQAERPGIGAAELRDRLRGVYIFHSYRARLDHTSAVWTAQAHGPVGYLLALLVVAPVAAAWGSTFGPGREVVARWIDAAIDQVGRGPAEPPTAPARGNGR